MSKLDGALQLALAQWRVQLERARAGEQRYGRIEDLEAQQVPLLIRFIGDVQALRDHGMSVGLVDAGVARGYAALADVERLAALDDVTSIALRPAERPLLDRSVPEVRAPQVWNAPTSFKGRGVIIGIIDTGIDIFHASFQRRHIGTAVPPKTRILRLWDQDMVFPGKGPPIRPDGNPYGAGCEFTDEDINAALVAGADTWPHKDRDGHGTHVAGIAAGNGQQHDGCSGPWKYIGVAPEADLVIVRALRLARRELSDLDAALRYILDVAARPEIAKPVVVNMSFGGHTGAHDGTDAGAVFIDDQIVDRSSGTFHPGIAVVIGAGNDGDEDIHFSANMPAGGNLAITFHVHADRPDRERDTVGIWYDLLSSLDFTLRLPDGNSTGRVSPSAPPPGPVSGHTIHVATTAAAAGSLKNHLLFRITPPPLLPVMTGPWTIILDETEGRATPVDIWIDTDSTDGFPTFRPPLAVAGANPAFRINSITARARARHAIVVGSYNDQTGRLAPGSSLGPALPPGAGSADIRPALTAPGEGIYAAKSRASETRPCCVCCPDHHLNMSGTSMATPHVTGAVALMLEKNRNLTAEQIRTHLQLTARIDGIPNDEQPPILDDVTELRGNNIWGSGKLDVLAAVNAVPALGGGGGGPVPFPMMEAPWAQPTPADRLREWERMLSGRPVFELLAALVSTHVDEVWRLIDGNRRVATIWHRNGGPLLVRHALQLEAAATARLPAAVGGHETRTLLDRLLSICARYGSAALRADIARYRALVLALPGLGLDEIEARALAGAAA